MPRPDDGEKPGVSAEDESVLIRHGKAPKYTPANAEERAAPPPAPVTVETVRKPADPAAPATLVITFSVLLFLLFFTTVGFLLRRRLIHPLLHRLGLTDEYGGFDPRLPWKR